MLRLRLNELIAECNEGLPPEQQISMQNLADAIGVPRSTLAGLTNFSRRRPVTNTAYLEALCRFFSLRLRGRRRRRFDWTDLLEFNPPLEVPGTVVVDELYPERVARGGRTPRTGH
jgi:hypothetical protein